MRGKSKFFSLLLVMMILITVVVIPVSAAAPEALASPGVAVISQEQTPADSPLKDMAVEALALTLFTTGLTSLLKKFGVKGNWLTAGALLMAVAIGVGYKVALKPPIGFADWFFYGLFGLLCGLVATGIYDAYGNKITDTAG